MVGNRWSGSQLFVAVCCAALLGCGDSDNFSTATPATRSERVWVDTGRATPRTAAYPGAPTRTLRVLLWRPAGAQPLPVLLMAHGFGGLPEKFDAFARRVAAAGFLVAAPAFPLTNENAPGGHELGLRDFVNQPADLSFVITQLLQAARSPGDPLEGGIAEDEIAVLGHSLGGVTVIALTRKDCCRDARVGATILVAAVASLAGSFGSDPVAASGPPTLIIHGTADASVPYDSSLALYDLIRAPRYLLGVAGAGHSEGLESQAEPAIAARDAMQRATIAFLDAEFRGATSALVQTLAGLAADGDVVQADAGL